MACCSTRFPCSRAARCPGPGAGQGTTRASARPWRATFTSRRFPRSRINLRNYRETVLHPVSPGGVPAGAMAVRHGQAAGSEPAVCGQHDPHRACGRGSVLRERPAGHREDDPAPRPDRGYRRPAGVRHGQPAQPGGCLHHLATMAGPTRERHSVKAPRRELTGFEIVVALSNNNAVENITKGSPALGAIGVEWQHEAQYFAEQATSFLSEPAWGMVAAPLGNAESAKSSATGSGGRTAECGHCSRPWKETHPRSPIGGRRPTGSVRRGQVAADLAAERAAADAGPASDLPLQAVPQADPRVVTLCVRRQSAIRCDTACR